jgi:uncharacterized protein YkwD
MLRSSATFCVALTLLLAAAPEDDKALLRAIVEAHNRERAAKKLPPLSVEPKLALVAQGHASDMAFHQKMTHDGSDGSSPFDRIKRSGYNYKTAAENVAEGWRTVDQLMKGWMNSPRHRDNILGNFSQIGIALARDEDGKPYYSAEFATPEPEFDPENASDDLLPRINKERASKKKPPFKSNLKLKNAASRIARSFAKVDALDLEKAPESDLVKNLKTAGYKYQRVAETAAAGPLTAEDALMHWMENDDARGHILGEFSQIGIGCSRAESGTPYWCLIFASPAAR